ncbi:MAG: hypothetical protein ABSF29_15275 [Tepidisphaeraceae bacterium]|jgi:hypothetical protein
MSTSARVDSIDSIKEFRVYLTKFQEMATIALGDADSEMARVQNWLEGEQDNYWSGQIRKRQELVSRAEEAYRGKKLFKDATGTTASAIEEQKALQVAKKNLAEAQQKLNNVRQWNRKLQKEIVLYRGGVAAFSNAVSAGIPSAIAHLGATIESLEKYIGIAAAAASDVGGEAASVAGMESGRGSMARAPDTKPAAKEEAAVDPKALRETVPRENSVGEPVPLALVNLICGSVKPEQRQAAATLPAGEAAGDDETVILSAAAAWAERVFMVRMGPPGIFTWFVGAVDAAGDTVYNKALIGQVRAARPDLGELLNLPAGSLLIFDRDGLSGVYNSSNENVLPEIAEEVKG